MDRCEITLVVTEPSEKNLVVFFIAGKEAFVKYFLAIKPVKTVWSSLVNPILVGSSGKGEVHVASHRPNLFMFANFSNDSFPTSP